MSALMAVSAAPNWWSNGQTGGTFYPNNNNSNNDYPWNNGGTYVPSGSNSGHYNDKSGQCPYSNDRGYGGGLEWGGYGPRYNNCNSDYECPGEEKCCYYDGRKECAYPVVFY